ncbi:MAG: hypothetical protein ABI854_06920, partial [Betaproteobacteria bacterium]
SHTAPAAISVTGKIESRIVGLRMVNAPVAFWWLMRLDGMTAKRLHRHHRPPVTSMMAPVT